MDVWAGAEPPKGVLRRGQAHAEPAFDDVGAVLEGQAPARDPRVHPFAVLLDDSEQAGCFGEGQFGEQGGKLRFAAQRRELRWLAFELVRLRKEAGLEQKDVAKALRCTVAKVSYYETAERPVVLRDLDEVLLPLFKVPKSQWPDYVDAARHSRTKGWWKSYSETVPSWFSLYLGLEQGASQVQTLLWAVIDEAVLRRLVGGRKVMRGQLEHLVRVARESKATIQVLPFDRGAHPGVFGPFAIVTFPWPREPVVAHVVYIEHRAGGLYLEQPHEIEAHKVAFTHLKAQALTPDESVTFIERLAEECR
ncbi:helix-turn-helix transcriptional regulator [Amycolatopsis sp. NPDC004625]|uniref:helix-turn-helix domain-containing protein n=1 Tax=Amycolatopsis sp. NPDC004625 TaxID=3154670 RepID=UPI0033A65F11